VAFELAFGTSAVRPEDVDPLSLSEEVILEGGFRLRGVADLVERRRGARDLRVTDYKTGRASAPRHVVVGGGGVLQPVLYALAAERIFGAPVAESRLFYCTRAGQFQERPVRIAGTDAPARGREVLDAIDRAVSSGFLPAAPQAGACGICDFRDVCGPHEELRTSRKQPGPIEGLRAMRQWR
jgi:RecB family exonuclease